MGIRSLLVRILGDDRSVRAAFERSSVSAKTFGKDVTGAAARADVAFGRISKLAAGGFAGGIAAGVAIQGIRQATDAASDLHEQISKSEQVFGDSSPAILDWSKTTADAIGVSQTSALTAAGTFGNLFRAIGIGGPQAADTSRRLVQLAADLASFNNASPEDVLEALRSGLVGEQEPLRRFGVLLSEARVQQLALQQTGKDSVTELTNQEKALARVAIIFRDTGTAQGDFARTSSGLANQQRILAAQVSDLQANIGTLLLPAMVKITAAMVDGAEAANDLVGRLDAIGDVVIDPIEIVFDFKLPGGRSFGSSLGKGLLDAAGNLPNIGPLIQGARFALAGAFDDEARSQTPELAEQFAASLNQMIETSLSAAAAKIDPTLPPTPLVPQQTFTDLLFNVGKQGFATGATPEDILGPQILELPNRLKEALLDAENRGAGPREIREILQRQRRELVEALQDPRGLTSKQRLSLKQDLKSVNDAIDAQNNALTQASKDAADKRQDAIEKAKDAAERARGRQRAGFDALIAALSLKIDRAAVTRGFEDDLRRNTELQNAIRAQIRVEGRTTELVGDLLKARDARRELIAQRDTARQFRALGLTAEGEKPIPTVENLRKQLSQLSDRLGRDVTPKISRQFDQIGKVLAGKFGQVTPPIRQAIRDMFGDIRSEFDKEAQGPITRTSAINAGKILEGLGLTPQLEQTLRARLSRLNSVAGLASAPRVPRTRTTADFTTRPVIVESHTTLLLDNDVVARAVTRSQKQTARRNPTQKRGPNR